MLLNAAVKKTHDSEGSICMIEVTFPLDRFEVIGNENVCHHEILCEMRRAGVPAVGRMTLQGVAHGTLTYFTDKVFGDAVYRWTPVEPVEDDPAAGL